MLFSYTFVPHAMETVQDVIDFIFIDVWCEAPKVDYGIHLFKSCAPLHQIMNELYTRDLAGSLGQGSGKWFYENVNDIFNEFKKLDHQDIKIILRCYKENNSIEKLCSRSHGARPTRYSDLNETNKLLNQKLSAFFKKLYLSGFFELSFVKKTIGSDLNSYYADFIKVNDIGCCPFCGILPIDNEYDLTREAFDHFLPKSKYPFNSVNLKNLAPSCYKCNSGNKRDKDPLHDEEGRRRKAIYPFLRETPDFRVSIDVNAEDWEKLIPTDIGVLISSDSYPEELKTWNHLFRIKNRYSARCCGASGGKYWRNRIIEEAENYGLSPKEMLEAEIASAEKSPWSEANFLKKAFLVGCQKAGLFDDT